MSRILVVDDDRATALLIQDILVDEGYVVEVAHDGAVAIELMRVQLPDVVLVDRRMPVMDGIVFLKACRQEPNWSAVRIVLVSAQAEQVSGAAGFDGFLAKPFDVVDLLRTVEAAVAYLQVHAVAI